LGESTNVHIGGRLGSQLFVTSYRTAERIQSVLREFGFAVLINPMEGVLWK
jgi:hypothetical protein